MTPTEAIQAIRNTQESCEAVNWNEGAELWKGVAEALEPLKWRKPDPDEFIDEDAFYWNKWYSAKWHKDGESETTICDGGATWANLNASGMTLLAIAGPIPKPTEAE